MVVNFVFYGHQGWMMGDLARQIERHTPDITFVRSELPVGGADVYHVIRPNWCAENDHELPRPCLVSHHGQGVRGGRLLHGPKVIEAFRDADLIAVPDMQDVPELAAAHIDCDKVRWIPHGVDTSLFQPVSTRRAAKCRVLRVGRRYVEGHDFVYSAENKGAATLTGIIEGLHPQLFEVVLLTGGDDHWGEDTKIAEARGLACVMRSVPYEQYPTEYQSANVYLITSRSEGGPASLLEAMACGLPVVTTPTGMACDLVVDGETGLFYPFNDSDAAVACLERVYRESYWGSEKQRQRSRAMAEAFTWESVAKRYQACYAELALGQLRHVANTRSWSGGKIARTRCLKVSERESPLYQRLLDDWDLWGKGPSRDWEYPAVCAELWPQYPLATLGRTLVVGASNDLLALALCREFGDRVTCVDPLGFEVPWWFEDEQRQVVEQAPAGLASTDWPEGPTYIKAGVEAAGLKPGSFDTAVSVSVIEHVPDPEAFLRAIAEALAPGGKLVLTAEYSPLGPATARELHLRVVGRGELATWAKAAGLVFVDGVDWDTHEGHQTMREDLPPHLRQRYDAHRKPPYFTPLIAVLRKR